MQNRIGSVVLTLACLLAVPVLAYGQDGPKNSLSAGYTFLKLNGDSHHGVAVDFNRDCRPHGNTILRGVAQFAQLHSRPRDITMAAVGVQLAWTNLDRVVPFAEAAVGIFRQVNTNATRQNAVINYGVGADFKINDEDLWRIRAFLGWSSLLGRNSETGMRFIAAAQRRF